MPSLADLLAYARSSAQGPQVPDLQALPWTEQAPQPSPLPYAGTPPQPQSLPWSPQMAPQGGMGPLGPLGNAQDPLRAPPQGGASRRGAFARGPGGRGGPLA